jgi:hypothetical protein
MSSRLTKTLNFSHCIRLNVYEVSFVELLPPDPLAKDLVLAGSAAKILGCTSLICIRQDSRKNGSKTSIKDFVESKELIFTKGSEFYQLSKPEIIQLNKKILIQRPSDLSKLITGKSIRYELC